jgi:hypothetical protein
VRLLPVEVDLRAAVRAITSSKFWYLKQAVGNLLPTVSSTMIESELHGILCLMIKVQKV